ncbi:MAG TPA: cysteine desulfurase [Candidatus Thermoplasmatota archaeon]|nr:cysteine desulfurase [Candidatus Thermoplasmatota archaeon]
MSFDVERVRKDFPILDRMVKGRRLVYLDSAATTQKPTPVLEAMARYYARSNANVHRSIHTLGEEATEAYVGAHETVARFIGARGLEEIVFTKNCTEAINTVAYAWGLTNLERGDEVVVTRMEHHANFVPWQQIARAKGATLRIAPLDAEGRVDLEAYGALLGRRTKIVAFTGMSNVLGTITPAREMIRMAHDAGAVALVDGAQSVPHTKTDVRALDADFLAFSGHKMLGPTGIGVLYGKMDLLERMPPFQFGGEMIRRVEDENSSWNDLPWKFEAGTPMIAEAIGLAAAVDYLNGLGMDNVREHEERLVAKAYAALAAVPGVTLYGPKPGPERGGVVAFNVEGAHAHDLASLFDDAGIAVRAGHHCAQPLMRELDVPSAARASFYVYNTEAEVEALASAVARAREVLA